ncbi:MAG: OmpA family protein [Alphaproteobacteria bacterium]|jgi:chemotaxis protein MotB|uniref:flagellar motor protein MotB n=1 Tax=Devosia sp. XGJD_8 TaxID=3391187 RepID=UPI001E05D2BB|nr:OmpA family protein [Alphaproteobacteria bacterium]MBU1560688.1 OmpA family protein [Alphaproteobacteria bacterium]MBU2301928.1 OmpA family protein [Alphaproteobacteria bacterium]MBU2368978.1 OmpA family protein [Alphaproteobacteria bacterium]
MANYDQPIIIKKVKKNKHAHHGGAWKIAYADFVTAMMAFFLLLWLISMTTPEQKEGLASYFAPPNIAPTTSGSGGLMGGTALDNSTDALMAGSSPDVTVDASVTPKGKEFGTVEGALSGRDEKSGSEFDAAKASQYDLKATDDQGFHSAAASIRQAWQAMPDITEIADNLLVEETSEGLNIRIIDQEGRPMFPEGSKYPNEVTRQAIAAIAPILQRLSSPVRIAGHTAAGGVYANPRYGSWELSADRANTVRQILGEFGLSDDRVDSVVGRSTVQPFFPNDPYMAANERIEITLLYETPPVPADLKP